MLCLSILRKTNTSIKANSKENKEHRKSAQVEILN